MKSRPNRDRLHHSQASDSYTYYVNPPKKTEKVDIKEVIEDLKFIESALAKGNRDYKKITALHLIDCKLNDEEIKLLADYLQDHPTGIISLKLNHNLIKDDGMKILVDMMLHKNVVLTNFEMSFNRHTKVGINYLIEKLIEPFFIVDHKQEVESYPCAMRLDTKSYSIQWSANEKFDKIINICKGVRGLRYIPRLSILSWLEHNKPVPSSPNVQNKNEVLDEKSLKK